jgi:multidrug transporter EmrE-like cation transporter
MGIHAVFTLLTEDFTYSPAYLLTYLPVSACYILSMAFSFFGMRFIEESISDPIENTSGAMCSLMCVLFLGDRLDAMIWVAIGIITIGVVGIGVLENSGEDAREVAYRMAELLGAEVVAVTGRKLLLYRVSSKKPVIELP